MKTVLELSPDKMDEKLAKAAEDLYKRPCPACGGNWLAYFVSVHRVACTRCGCSTIHVGEGVDEEAAMRSAIFAWNLMCVEAGKK